MQRAGFGVPPKRTSRCTFVSLRRLRTFNKGSRCRGHDRSRRRGTRPRALPQTRVTTRGDSRRWRLLAMPLLRNVLNPWLADVIHQHESQSICVWPAELIHARASAIFGNRPFMVGLVHCDGVAGKRIRAPDLCPWICDRSVKGSVGINRPDRAERIAPLPG